MDRIIIFTDFSTLSVTTTLINAAVKSASISKHFQIAGICVRHFEKHHHLMYRHFQGFLKTGIKTFFDKTRHPKFSPPMPVNIEKLARQHRFKLLIPPENNINDAGFIRQIKTKLKPTVALSFYCLQKFSPRLLEAFDYTVNYHNGILPDYRGRMATCWSIYHQDPTSGYTFHRITDKMDAGNTLIQGLVPVKTHFRVQDIEHEKAVRAAKNMPALFEIIMRREIGQFQEGTGKYFSKKDSEHIKIIRKPSELSHDELICRLRAFGSLLMNIEDVWYDITKLEKLSVPPDNSKTIYFQTSDGVIMRPVRFWFLPFFMYQFFRRAGWTMPSGKVFLDAQ